MKHAVLAAGAAAAFLVLAPGAALAATPATPAGGFPGGPVTRISKQLSLSPAKALPGTRVNFDFGCSARPGEKVVMRSAALVADRPGFAFGTVKNVKPGKYAVMLRCGPQASRAWFEVLPAAKQAATPPAKQVAKVPAGAPQAGGADDPAGAPIAAAAAMGVLALGAGGLVAARRVWRR